MKVKLEAVIDAIEMTDDNYTYFLDLETGEFETAYKVWHS